MKKYKEIAHKKTFLEDLISPLDETQRYYIRRPILIFYTPFIILFAKLQEGELEKLYKKCW